MNTTSLTIAPVANFPLNADAKIAYTAFEMVDLEWVDSNHPGWRLTNTRHDYYEIACCCGHVTRTEPYRSIPDDSLPSIVCCEWRVDAGQKPFKYAAFPNGLLTFRLVWVSRARHKNRLMKNQKWRLFFMARRSNPLPHGECGVWGRDPG